MHVRRNLLRRTRARDRLRARSAPPSGRGAARRGRPSKATSSSANTTLLTGLGAAPRAAARRRARSVHGPGRRRPDPRRVRAQWLPRRRCAFARRAQGRRRHGDLHGRGGATGGHAHRDHRAAGRSTGGQGSRPAAAQGRQAVQLRGVRPGQAAAARRGAGRRLRPRAARRERGRRPRRDTPRSSSSTTRRAPSASSVRSRSPEPPASSPRPCSTASRSRRARPTPPRRSSRPSATSMASGDSRRCGSTPIGPAARSSASRSRSPRARATRSSSAAASGSIRTSYEVRGRAGYSIAGWPFPLDIVTLDLRPAYAILRDGSAYEPRIRALARLERQDLFWTYTKSSVEAGYNYLTVEAYTSYGAAGTARVRDPARQRARDAAGRLGDRGGRVQPHQPADRPDDERAAAARSDAAGRGCTSTTTSASPAFQQALIVDLRDHPIEPTLGAYAELRTTEGTPYAGGAYSYFSLVPDVRGYVPLLVGRRARRTRTVRRDLRRRCPPTERFFSGGTSSQRGFAERRLSPHVDPVMGGSGPSVPYGGAGLIDTGVEARVPITKIRTMPLGRARCSSTAATSPRRPRTSIR